MAIISGGELLARAMAIEGVEFVFGLPSPESDPLLARMSAHGIRFVPVRHEAAGVHMAEGLYKTTGRVSAVLGNPGPGSANLLPGVITALHEGVPVLVVTTQHRLGLVYPSSPATFQGQDQLDVFRPTVKWGAPILEWGRIPEVLRLAFREMWRGRPGPVHVEVPAPVLYAEGEESSVTMPAPTRYRGTGPQASASQLVEAATLLATARRPIVFAGSGVDRAGANDALVRVVELLNCPVLSSMAGRSVIRRDHPNHVVGFGAAGDEARRAADVMLIVGSRVGNLDLPYDKYWGDPSEQRVIQIDVDPRSLGVSRPVDVAILADARDALEGLAECLEAAGVARGDPDELARLRALDDRALADQAGPILGWAGPGIHPAHAAGTVGAVFGPDAIYTVDGGNTSLWAYAMLPSTRPNSYHSILEFGMLGTGIPAAIGAKLGAPERVVVCVTGDGAAGFNVMELQSAAREGVALTVVVFAEGSWSMEEYNELAQYGQTYGTTQGDVRWDVVAQGLGCHGEFVDRIEDLEPALRRALAYDGPSLVCVKTDHDANLAVPAAMISRFFEVYSGPGDDAIT